MKVTINTNVIEEKGFSLQEFLVLLYYILGKKDTFIPEVSKHLWEKGYLMKTLEGYTIDNNKITELENIFIESSSDTKEEEITKLANDLKNLYPQGKKDGTSYYWRDSTKIIVTRLKAFFKKYGKFKDEDIVDATRRYVESFNGNYQYMQLLKYFIYKKGKESGDETSQLASWLENKEQVNLLNDWTTELI